MPNSEINEEAKVQEHDIQSLLFENYSMLISTIETVREMKDNISLVEDKLRVLEKSMNKISKLALTIDPVKRNEIQMLGTIKNMYELPSSLQQDIKYNNILTEASQITRK